MSRIGWVAALVAGCGWAVSGCDLLDFEETRSSEHVLAINGETVRLNGTWSGECEADGEGGTGQRVLSFDGDAHALTQLAWEDLLDGCSGSPASVETQIGTITIDGEKEVTWNGPAPTGLPDTVTASTYMLVLKEPEEMKGATVTGVAVADIEDSPSVLYAGTTLDIPAGTDGYPSLLETGGYTK